MELGSLLFSNISPKQTIFKNTFWLATATIFSYVIGFFFIAYVARALPVVEYGKFNFAFNLLSFLTIFADLGISTIMVREIAKEREKEKEYIGSLFSLKLFLSLIFLSLVIVLSFFVASDEAIRNVIFILAIYCIFGQFINFFYSLFRGREKMQYEAFFQIFNVILYTSIGFLLISQDPSISKLSLAYLIGAGITFLTLFALYTKKFNRLRLLIDKNTWKKFLSLSWPLALIVVFGTVYHSIDSVMLGMWGMMRENGLYAAAYKVFDVAIVPISLISASFLPILSKVFGSSSASIQAREEVFLPRLSVSVILGVPICVGGILFASPIIEMIFGVKYLGAVWAFQVLMATLLIIHLNDSFNSVLFAANFQKITFWITIGGAILNIILNLILIPRYTLNGAAVATFITYFLDWLAFMYLAKKLLNLTLFRVQFFKVLISCFISAAIMAFIMLSLAISKLSFFLVILLGGAIYFSLMLLLNKVFRLGLL